MSRSDRPPRAHVRPPPSPQVARIEVDVDLYSIGVTPKTFMCLHCLCAEFGCFYDAPECLACNTKGNCLCAEEACACGYTDDGVRVCCVETTQGTCCDCNTPAAKILSSCVCMSNLLCCLKCGSSYSYDFAKCHPGFICYEHCCCSLCRCALLPDEVTPCAIGLCGMVCCGKKAAAGAYEGRADAAVSAGIEMER